MPETQMLWIWYTDTKVYYKCTNTLIYNYVLLWPIYMCGN